MRSGLKFLGCAAGLVVALSLASRAASPATMPVENAAPGEQSSAVPLVWDAMQKTIVAAPGAESVDFDFTVANTSDAAVKIEQLRPTCGCTVVEMPSSPWVIPPHGHGTFTGTVDLRGKEGALSKAIFVNTTKGTQVLRLSINIPEMDETARRRARAVAQADRQAVFRGECATCHVTPTIGKSSGELFTAACGVCHFSPRRAGMVPDLLVAHQHRDAAFWRKWITEGKEGTLMPAWSKARGGPLTDEQIESLVAYAVKMLPTEPRPSELAPAKPVSGSSPIPHQRR